MTPIDHAVLTLAALVIAVDSRPDGPRADTCQVAIRRQGAKLAEAGGVSAMRAALARVLALSPARQDERRAIILSAWVGLPGWRAQA